jgi:zinc protease
MRDERVSSPLWQRKYLTPASRDLSQREEHALSLLADVLGGGSQSRLHQKLTLEKKIAAYVGAWSSTDSLDSGSFAIYAAPNPGASTVEIEKIIDEELALIRDKGISQDELNRTRDRSIAEATYVLDSQESLARIFGVALTTGQSIDDVMNWERDLATVTVEDVAKAAKSVLDLRASVTGLLLPANGS